MRSLYFALIIISSVIFMANRSGRGAVSGNGATTAPGESGTTCGSIGCHFNGSFNPEATIRLLNQDSVPVQAYISEEKYIIEISADHTGTPAGYGFQFVALRSSDNSGIDGFDQFPNRIRSINIGDRSYVEHSNILSTNPIYLDWEAPAAGNGEIDFYAAINLVNGNGSSSGDGADTTRLTIFEEEVSSLFDRPSATNISIWPNPASNYVTIDTDIQYESVSIHGISGQKLLEINWSQKKHLDISNLDSGIYFMMIHLPTGKTHTKKLFVQ